MAFIIQKNNVFTGILVVVSFLILTRNMLCKRAEKELRFSIQLAFSRCFIT